MPTIRSLNKESEAFAHKAFHDDLLSKLLSEKAIRDAERRTAQQV
jgi:hypothetical protein